MNPTLLKKIYLGLCALALLTLFMPYVAHEEMELSGMDMLFGVSSLPESLAEGYAAAGVGPEAIAKIEAEFVEGFNEHRWGSKGSVEHIIAFTVVYWAFAPLAIFAGIMAVWGSSRWASILVTLISLLGAAAVILVVVIDADPDRGTKLGLAIASKSMAAFYLASLVLGVLMTVRPENRRASA